MANIHSNQWLLNNTLAGQIAQKLNSTDSDSSDNKIDGSVWNAFAQENGIEGQNINENEKMSLVKAMNLITKFAVRLAHQAGENVDEFAKKWLDKIEGKDEGTDNTSAGRAEAKQETTASRDTKGAEGGKDAGDNSSPQYDETACPGIFYDKNTKTHYKKVGNEYKAMTSKHGNITMVRADGSYITKEKDSNGVWNTICDANDNVIEERLFKNGKLDTYKNYQQKFIQEYENGKIEWKTTYNEKIGGSVRTITHFGDGKADYQIDCNSDGIPIKVTYPGKNKAYKLELLKKGDDYSRDDSVIIKWVNENGEYDGYRKFTHKGAVFCTCDENGKKIEEP